jgi:esterase/lipase
MKKQNPFLQPSGYQVDVKPTLAFKDYLKSAQDLVTHARQDLTDIDGDKIIQANSPFEYIPAIVHANNRIGVLLIHGLFDCPLVMQDVAQYFVENNYWVRSVLLPGHGTVPGDLLTVNYQQWLDTVLYGINSFNGLVDKIYLVGFSTGALISIYHALQGIKVASLILLSPGLSAKYQFVRTVLFYRLLAQRWSKLEWLRVGANQDYARYESFPLNAVYQFYQLSLATAKLHRQRTLNMPIFMALSEDDYIINSGAAVKWLIKQTNKHNKLILYSNKINNHCPQQIKMVASHYVDLKIKNFSHVCIPIAPDNYHYGAQGDYVNFQMAAERLHAKIIYAGSKNLYFPNHSKMLNLSYNPGFTGLIQELDTFINRC